jgi:8-oxo-dGTP diphosphatase
MNEIKRNIIDTFGHRLRTRISGICVHDDEILLVKHLSIGKSDILWVPPGGGMQFGENAENCLKREMLEECGLDIEMGKLLFVYEYLDQPLHAIELFFEITSIKGDIQKGFDPELDNFNQIITEVRWMPFNEIKSLPKEQFHGILHKVNSTKELLSLNGYHYIASNR